MSLPSDLSIGNKKRGNGSLVVRSQLSAKLAFQTATGRRGTHLSVEDRADSTEVGATNGQEVKRCVRQIHGTVGTENIKEIMRGDLSNTEELDLKLSCDYAIPHEPMMIELPGGRFYFLS